MKYTITFLILLALSFHGAAQQTGYYNGADGTSGEELKTALYNVIKGHTSYEYYSSSTVFEESDQDPNNPENVILVYTGRSADNGNYGSGGDYINREHVWAKSHGDFGEEPPEGSDFHNLKPADASVNMDRSNLDFDNGGTQHSEATGCFFDGNSWEPRDEVKGDIARILFYMATRYEGENGEEDLQLVDDVNTSPAPEHGKLSTLLEWNNQDPPDAFERNRNNVIFRWQHNRNPFIDNPQWANLIWNDAEENPIVIDNIAITNDEITSEEAIEITAEISSSAGTVNSASIMWGLSYNNLENEIGMNSDGGTYSGAIPPQTEEDTIFYKIVASDDVNSDESVVYSYYIPPEFNGELETIYDIQGQQDLSPMADRIVNQDGTEELNYGEVSTSGVVTANFGEMYFIQDGEGPWNGVMVYDNGRNPQLGDSIIVTGLIAEYYNMTEITDISGYYHIASGKSLPEPTIINTGEASEEYESILVKVVEAECTFDNYQGNYYMWRVDDGTGELKIHNTATFEYDPTEGETYTITGPLNWDFGEFKIELRFESDVQGVQDEEAPEILSIETDGPTELEVNFSEEVEETSAENNDNYTISGGIEVTNAVRHLLDNKQVILTVSEMTDGESYELTISGVTDLNGNAMDESTVTFDYDTEGIEEYINQGSLVISPNPFKEKLTINLAATKAINGNLKILSLKGKPLINKALSLDEGVNSYHINAKNLKKGLFILKLEIDGYSINKKIIKY